MGKAQKRAQRRKKEKKEKAGMVEPNEISVQPLQDIDASLQTNIPDNANEEVVEVETIELDEKFSLAFDTNLVNKINLDLIKLRENRIITNFRYWKHNHNEQLIDVYLNCIPHGIPISEFSEHAYLTYNRKRDPYPVGSNPRLDMLRSFCFDREYNFFVEDIDPIPNTEYCEWILFGKKEEHCEITEDLDEEEEM